MGVCVWMCVKKREKKCGVILKQTLTKSTSSKWRNPIKKVGKCEY